MCLVKSHKDKKKHSLLIFERLEMLISIFYIYILKFLCKYLAIDFKYISFFFKIYRIEIEDEVIFDYIFAKNI